MNASCFSSIQQFQNNAASICEFPFNSPIGFMQAFKDPKAIVNICSDLNCQIAFDADFKKVNQECSSFLSPFKSSFPILVGDVQYKSSSECTVFDQDNILCVSKLLESAKICDSIHACSKDNIEKLKRSICTVCTRDIFTQKETKTVLLHGTFYSFIVDMIKDDRVCGKDFLMVERENIESVQDHQDYSVSSFGILRVCWILIISLLLVGT